MISKTDDSRVPTSDSWASNIYGAPAPYRVWLFLVEHILPPFAVLLPLLKKSPPKHEGAKPRSGFFTWNTAILILFVSVGIVSAIFTLVGRPIPYLPGGALKVAAFGWLVNGVSLLALYLVYRTELARDTIVKQTTLIEKNTAELIGDRLWAEGDTNKLLSKILEKAHDERAKWHIIKFLAHLVDGHIERGEDGTHFRLRTDAGGVWHIAKYSKFLSENIDHATDEILWLVDPRDLCDTLVSECIEYVLASIAVHLADEPLREVWKKDGRTHYKNVFRDMVAKAANRIGHSDKGQVDAAVKTVFAPDSGDGVQQVHLHDKNPHWWHEHSYVLKAMTEIGRLLVTNDPSHLEDGSVDSGFRTLYEGWLEDAFPHVAAFQRCRAKEHRRVLFVPRPCNATDEEAIECLADEMFRKIREEFGNIMNGGLGEGLSAHVLEQALLLMGRLSGGDHAIRVVVSTDTADIPDRTLYDIGIYDKHFAVWACRPATEDDSSDEPTGDVHLDALEGYQQSRYDMQYYRTISWFYLPDHEKLKGLPKDFLYGLSVLSGDEAKDIATDNYKCSYERFRHIVLARWQKQLVPKNE